MTRLLVASRWAQTHHDRVGAEQREGCNRRVLGNLFGYYREMPRLPGAEA